MHGRLPGTYNVLQLPRPRVCLRDKARLTSTRYGRNTVMASRQQLLSQIGHGLSFVRQACPYHRPDVLTGRCSYLRDSMRCTV